MYPSLFIILPFCFRFMPPDDPLGRHGPSLDNFLRKRPVMPEQKKQPCPYGKSIKPTNVIMSHYGYCEWLDQGDFRLKKTPKSHQTFLDLRIDHRVEFFACNRLNKYQAVRRSHYFHDAVLQSAVSHGCCSSEIVRAYPSVKNKYSTNANMSDFTCLLCLQLI